MRLSKPLPPARQRRPSGRSPALPVNRLLRDATGTDCPLIGALGASRKPRRAVSISQDILRNG